MSSAATRTSGSHRRSSNSLALLARNADRVLTHRAILKAIWGPNAVDQPEHLWVLMAQLRKKIEPDPGTPRYLLSEPWVGYRLVSSPPA
jgi:two-component system KDP operon response regulator KdpE